VATRPAADAGLLVIGAANVLVTLPDARATSRATSRRQGSAPHRPRTGNRA
jgi:hypothetical protein